MTESENTPPDLLSLPPELHLQILSHLPFSSHLILKLTSKTLYNTLPLSSGNSSETFSSLLKTLPMCERLTLRRSLYEPHDRANGKRWCIVCSMLQSAKFFHMEGVPVCAWHESWMMKAAVPWGALEGEVVKVLRRRVGGAGLVGAKDSAGDDGSSSDTFRKAEMCGDEGGDVEGPRWVRLRRKLCGQCLRIQFWDAMPAESKTKSQKPRSSDGGKQMSGDGIYKEKEDTFDNEKGSCRCACTACGVFSVDCFVRLDGRASADYPRVWDWPRWEKREDGVEKCVIAELHRGRGGLATTDEGSTTIRPTISAADSKTYSGIELGRMQWKKVPVVDFCDLDEIPR